MNVSLYQAAAAMNAQMRLQEVITGNMASAYVPGFRRQDISFSAVEAGMESAAAGTNAPHYFIPSATAVVDFSEGEARPSGGLMDFAIEGPAFFEVQLPNGNKAYTRNGEFHINSQGQLVTKQGYPVMGENGPLLVENNSSLPLSVSPSGEVSQNGQLKGKMHIVEFSDTRSLAPIGQGMFLADQATPLPANVIASSVRQGMVEASNTSPTLEMATLVTSMRMFEANQRVLASQDERLGKVITELGNPT